MVSAVPEIQIDQVLVGNAQFRSQGLEVGNGVLIQPDRDGLLEVLDVGVLLTLHFCKIVMCSHFLYLQYASTSFLSAFLADIIRTTVSFSLKQ